MERVPAGTISRTAFESAMSLKRDCSAPFILLGDREDIVSDVDE